LHANIDRALHEGGNFSAQVVHLQAQTVFDHIERQPGVVGVEEVGRLGQLAGAEVGVGVDDAVLHVAIGRHNDDQHPTLGQAQKLNVAKRCTALGHHDDTDKVRQAGQEVGRIADDALRLVWQQRGGHIGREVQCIAPHGEHGVNEQAVTLGCGYPPCRGVGAGNQTQLFQVAHHVADGGGRQVKSRSLGQGAGTHGLAVGDVALDQSPEE